MPVDGFKTYVSNLPIATAGGGTVLYVVAGTGLNGGTISVAGTISLANTGASAGTYGSSSTYPVISVNAQGQITSVSNQTVAVSATNITSGVLATTYGGTGNTSTPTNGQLLIGNGTGYSVNTLTAGAGISITNTSGAITVAYQGFGGANTYTRTSFTATASQSVFTVNYTVSLLQVYLNGVLLNAADYTATNGTSITLGVACNAGDLLETVTFTTFATISVLPVVNGGTGTGTAFTQGSVVFSGASGVYSQNNSQFYWDNTNSRLGIGTSSPAYKLSVSTSSLGNDGVSISNTGTGSVSQAVLSVAAQGYAGVQLGQNYSSGNYFIYGGDAKDMSISTTATERMRITAAGNVGIGTSSPAYALEVAKPVFFNSSNVVSQSILFGGNGGMPPEIFGGSFGINSSGGRGEIDYWNAYSSATYSHSWYQLIGASTSKLLASLTPSGNLLVHAGKIGINTDTPGSALDVVGNINASYISTNSSISTTPVLSFNGSNTALAQGASVTASYLQDILQNKSATAGSSTNYVASNNIGTDSSYYGEFGINSSVFSSGTPSDFYSINNGVYFSGHDGDISVGSGNGYKTYLTWGTAGQSAHVINAAGAIGFSTNLASTVANTGTIGYGTSGALAVTQGSGAAPVWSTNVFVNSLGIGSGTSSPQNFVDAVGDYGIIASRANTTAAYSWVAAQAGNYYSLPSYTASILQTYGSTASGNLPTLTTVSAAGSGAVYFQNTTNGLVYTNNSAPIIFGTNGAERARISPAGNVGIGTSSPAQPLDVVGNINSSGTISAAAMTSSSKAVVTTGPRFNAWVTTAVTLTSGTQVVLLFKSITFDSTTAVNTTTGVITPGVAGYYFVTATVQFVTTGTLTAALVVIKQNGVQKANSYTQGATGAYQTFSQTSTTILNLSASDPITVEVYATGTGTITANGGNAYTSWITANFISAT